MSDSVIGNSKCEACELHRTAEWVCLMGSGRIPARIMIIGEAPGHREDEVGKPFQGKSGKLLDQLLEGIGLDRGKVYITNTVRCRPPENRTPTPNEIKACSQYMQKELGEVRPKFILLLGAIALKGLLKKKGITELRGQVFDLKGAKVMATFHPAAALRDPTRLNPIKDDFKKFSNLINGKTPQLPKIQVSIVETAGQVGMMLKDIIKSKNFSFDIETNTLDRFMDGARIHCIGFGTDTGTWIVPMQLEGQVNFDNIKKQKEILSLVGNYSRGKSISGQNAKFDNLFLEHLYGIKFGLNFDTMLASHLLDENDQHGLKYMVRTKLNGPDYDLSKEDKINPADPQQLFEYCGLDNHYTLQLKHKFRKQLDTDESLGKLFDTLVMPAARVYEQIEANGCYVDPQKFAEAKDYVHIRVRKALRKLERHVKSEINWNSPDQVQKLLFEKMELEPVDFTGKGVPSTGEPSLLRMRDQHPIVQALLDYRGAEKLRSGYIDGWQKRMHGNWLHPSYKLHGTVTGRPSCTDPNMQQVPRDEIIRSCIGAPDGWIHFELDYSQIELRIAAMLANERNMLRIFQSGGDIHVSTACDAMGVSADQITKEQRKSAKAINFGFIFGMWWKKFREYAFDKYDLVLTDREAREFRERFFEMYPDLTKWHDRQKRVVRALGQVRTLTGRIRHLPNVFSEDKSLSQEAERQSINSPVQGFAAELTLMSIIEIKRSYSNDIIQLSGTVHDATLGRIREDHVNKLKDIQKMMCHPPILDELGIELTVPILVDLKIGNWGIGKALESSTRIKV